MEKLDCLVWAAGISFISFGMRIGVRVSTPELLEKVLAYLPPGWKFAPSPRVERLYSLIAGGVGPQPNVRCPAGRKRPCAPVSQTAFHQRTRLSRANEGRGGRRREARTA